MQEWDYRPFRIKSLRDLVGHKFSKVERIDNDCIKFYLSDTRYVIMHHEQDCCESVEIMDICGDLEDLVDAPIVHFEARHSSKYVPFGTETWTFYDIQTAKGSVNIRWQGESNGYYSEEVDLEYVDENKRSDRYSSWRVNLYDYWENK